jgi:hypothetical protein
MVTSIILTLVIGQEYIMPEMGRFNIDAFTVLVILLGGLLLTASAGAFMFILSIWAKNIRESQVYSSYFPLALILPTVFMNIYASMGETPKWSYLLPLINVYAIVRDAIMKTLSFKMTLIGLIIDLGIVIIAILTVSRILKSEKVILRS